MGKPELRSQKSCRQAYAGSGDHVAHEMPVARDQQNCRKEQQRGKRPDAGSIESDEDTCKGAGENHVTGGEAAAGRAAEKVENMRGPVEDGFRIRYPKEEL